MEQTDKFHIHLHLAQELATLDLNNKYHLIEFQTLLTQQQGRITYRNNFLIGHINIWLNNCIAYLQQKETRIKDKILLDSSYKDYEYDTSDSDSNGTTHT